MTPDDALDRLRAADPAAGTEPDMAAIRAAVAAATGLPLAAEPAPHDELAARRHRRAAWVRAVAAVAAVAVVGTGGYLVADAMGGDASTAASALPVISLQGGAGSGPVAAPEMAAPQSDVGRAASGADVPAPAVGYASIMPGYAGHVVFTGQGLPTTGGSAVAWGFDASSVASADTAARVAAALGVTGSPRVEWGAWVVGPSDGSGATVRLDGTGQVSFNDPRRDPWQCQNGAAGQSSPGSPAEGVLVPQAPVSQPPVPDGVVIPVPAQSPVAPGPADPSVCTAGSTPTGDAAVSRARQALDAVGIDTTGAQVQADDSNGKSQGSTGADYVNVAFQQVIDGGLTGIGWSVTLVGDGVQSLNGPLAPLVQLGSYDVISAAQAVDRLNDPRFGASGGGISPLVGRMYAAEGSVAGEPSSTVATPSPSQDPTVPAAPKAGAAFSWPVRQVTLVSARLGLALTYQPDGGQVLVPAYALTDTTGATWSVVAVTDAHLDFTDSAGK